VVAVLNVAAFHLFRADPLSFVPSSFVMSAVRKLGKYIMLETLGKGAFSKVRLGIDEQTGERVALKVIRKAAASGDAAGIPPELIKQVEHEVAAMQKIEHGNIIKLKAVDWDIEYTKKNGSKLRVILVVLELATGGEMFDYLAFTGAFEEAIARSVKGGSDRRTREESDNLRDRIREFAYRFTVGCLQDLLSATHCRSCVLPFEGHRAS
jgi:serine/threonine protein kinase